MLISFLRSRAVRVVLIVAIVLSGWYLGRSALLPNPPAPDAATLEHIRNVEILRDTFGVPHVFGKSDADAAFGLAYAHAEDDFPLIQGIAAASTGRLGLVQLSKQALINDYYANLIDVPGEIARDYQKLPADYRAILEAYARGLNFYAFRHPDQANPHLMPFRGSDVAAGFIHKIPIMAGLPKILQALNSKDGPKQVGDKIALLDSSGVQTMATRVRFPGSNTHAVARTRSADGITRLNVNSHQPWEGPVAWYEAHVVSEAGWNAIGGTFPGAPIILHGHNQHLGWAHTVNKPDIADVYRLTVDEKGRHYRLDGKWVPFEIRQAPLRVDLGLFTLTLHRDVLRSQHGPVMKTDNGTFAIRYAGMGRAMLAGVQWYRMNRARNFAEWKQAMATQGIPMFHTGYADRNNIHYVYNALLPERRPGHDYSKVLPGDRSDLIWKQYRPYDYLPSVTNPPSGFVQNCNTTPYQTTLGAGNPRPGSFAAEDGIETSMNNRGIRSLELFGTPGRISRETFLKYKWDRSYSKQGPMFTQVIEPLLRDFKPENDNERKAIELVRAWDGVANENSVGAVFPIFILQAISEEIPRAEFAHLKTVPEAFRAIVELVDGEFGRMDIKLSQIQRLQRGELDIGIGGGTDLLNAVHTVIRNGRLVGMAGDSYIMLVEFGDFGVRSFSRHQYGNSSRPDDLHYADQARAFAARTLKPSLLTREAIQAAGNWRSYRPGAELGEE